MARIFAPIVPPSDPEQCLPWLNRELRRISMALQQQGRGLSAIARGEAPDASGTKLVDLSGVFLLAGRPVDQVAAGSTRPSGNLTLTSTASTTKGFIYLGYPNIRVALDETNGYLGVGVSAPTQRLHVMTAAAGTSIVGTVGTPIVRVGYGSTTLGDILPILFNGGAYDLAIKPTNAFQISAGDNTSGMRFVSTASRAFFQCGYLNSGGSVLNANMTIGGLGATIGTNLGIAFGQVYFTNDLLAPKIGMGVGANPDTLSATWRGILAGIGPNTSEPFISASPFSLATGAPAIEVIAGLFGARLVTIEGFDGSYGRLVLWNGSGSRTGFITVAPSEVGGLKLAIFDKSAERAETIDRFNSWSDSLSTTHIQWGNGTFSATLAGQDASGFTRLAFISSNTLISDTFPFISQTAPTAILHLRNTVTASKVIFKVRAHSTQSGDMIQLLASNDSTVLSGFTSAGKYYLVSGAAANSILVSDANGVGSWTATLAMTVSFTDTLFTLADNTTPTKLLAWELAGISSSTTRTWSALDLSGAIPILGNDPPSVAAGSLGKVDLTAQVADITTTNLTNGPPSGDYEVWVYLQCTTADGAAGTLTVTIGWTDTVGATTDTTVTLALTATGRSRGRILVKRASGEITYAVANGGSYGSAQYAIDVRVMSMG